MFLRTYYLHLKEMNSSCVGIVYNCSFLVNYNLLKMVFNFSKSFLLACLVCVFLSFSDCRFSSVSNIVKFSSSVLRVL